MDSHQTTSGESVEIGWEEPKGVIGLSFKIFFLRLITLGIYHFWGKTRVRRVLWQAVRLNGQPFEYTGTGKELFLGFLIAVFLIFAPLILIIIGAALLLDQESPLFLVVMLLIYVFFFYLTGVAIYRARRYRLSRTRWRGIRGTMTGSPWAFAWTHFWTALMLPISLGWAFPWRRVKLNKLLTEQTRFGDRNFEFNGTTRPLYKPFAVLWIGAVVFYGAFGGIGAYVASQGGSGASWIALLIIPLVFLFIIAFLLVSIWYAVKEMNYFTACTRFDQTGFRLQATTGSLIGLALMNILILIISLGIAMPVIQVRVVRYFISRLDAVGSVDFAAIAQATDKMDKTGEGLAEAFDIDMF
mgnify:CR=1 FL=1